MQRDEALNISRLLLENADSNSEDDEIPTDKDRDLRSRLNTVPMVLKRKAYENIRKRKRSTPSPSKRESEEESSSISSTSEGTEASAQMASKRMNNSAREPLFPWGQYLGCS